MAQRLGTGSRGLLAAARTTSPREAVITCIKSIEQQQERWTEAYLAGVLSLDEYGRRRQQLEQRRQTVQQQEQQLQAQAHSQEQLAVLAGSLEEFCGRVQAGLQAATFAQRRELVELLIDRVVVTGEEVEIRYVLPTSPASKQTRFCQLRLDYFPHSL